MKNILYHEQYIAVILRTTLLANCSSAEQESISVKL
jgi:hypothetical protein